MMRRFLPPAAIVATLALCLGFAPGCSDDDDNGTEPDLITQEDFAGSWTGTKFLVKSQANPAIQFDLITVGGSFTMVTAGDGAFTGEAQIPDLANPGQLLTLPLAGTFSLLDQEHVEVVFDPEIPPMFTSFSGEFTLSSDRITIVDTNTTFDFDEDGTEDPAIFEGELVRS